MVEEPFNIHYPKNYFFCINSMENNMEEFEMQEIVIYYNNNPEKYNKFMRAIRNVEIFLVFHLLTMKLKLLMIIMEIMKILDIILM